jgi:Berberine and berberine like
VFSKSEFFRRPLPPEAITALLRNLPRGWGAGQSRALNFTPLGGAYNRVPADATAYVHRDERFLVEHVAVVDPEAATATRGTARQWVARSRACVHPWGSGRVYPNFPDPDLADWTEAYYAGNFPRLAAAKQAYDPDRLFKFPQSI